MIHPLSDSANNSGNNSDKQPSNLMEEDNIQQISSKNSQKELLKTEENSDEESGNFFSTFKSMSMINSVTAVSEKSENQSQSQLPKNGLAKESKETKPEESKLNIRISFRAYGKPTAVLKLYGTLDTKTIKLLRFASDMCITKNVKSIIMDMSNVIYIGSAGWGYFVAENIRLTKLGGTLILAEMKPEAYNLFTMLGIDKNVRAQQTVEKCQRVVDDTTSIVNNIYETKGYYIQGQNSSIIKVDESASATKDVPVFEKILQLIAKYGPCRFFEIKKYLKSKEFGCIELGPIQLYGILKEMNLENFKKRVRFYRSC